MNRRAELKREQARFPAAIDDAGRDDGLEAEADPSGMRADYRTSVPGTRVAGTRRRTKEPAAERATPREDDSA
jgi:hypothetical protein